MRTSLTFSGPRRFSRIALVAIGLASLGMTEARASFQDLLVTNINGANVTQYDPVTGAFKGVFAVTTPATGGNSFPRGLAIGANTNVFVGDFGNQSIQQFNGTTGASLGAFVPTGSGGISQPHGIAFRGGDCASSLAAQGNLFESCFSSNRILQFDGATGASLGDFVPSGLGGLTNPTGLAFAPTTAGVHAGNLFVASSGDSRILEFNGTTGAFVSAFAAGGLLNAPGGLKFAADGTLFVANFGGNNILRFGTSASNGGNGTLLTPTGISGGGLNGASSLVFDSTGGILTTSLNTNQILRFRIDGSNEIGRAHV